jgi:hypothetical protein
MDKMHNDMMLKSSGFIDIELHFKTALTENITVVIYGTYDQVVEIDSQGQTKFDTS